MYCLHTAVFISDGCRHGRRKKKQEPNEVKLLGHARQRPHPMPSHPSQIQVQKQCSTQVLRKFFVNISQVAFPVEAIYSRSYPFGCKPHQAHQPDHKPEPATSNPNRPKNNSPHADMPNARFRKFFARLIFFLRKLAVSG